MTLSGETTPKIKVKNSFKKNRSLAVYVNMSADFRWVLSCPSQCFFVILLIIPIIFQRKMLTFLNTTSTNSPRY